MPEEKDRARFEAHCRWANSPSHTWDACPDCKSAAANEHSHYALGQLRQAIGMELGIPYGVAMGMTLNDLCERRMAARAVKVVE